MNQKIKKLAIHGARPIRTKLFPPYRVIGKEEKKAVGSVLESGILSRYLGTWHADFYGGPQVQAFEREWAKYFKVKHAVAVNSASSALQCAMGAIGISPGDEVIVSPYTMIISATAPLWYGAIPVFADVEREYFCLDPRSVEKNITPRTKAVIVVDILGQPYDAGAINAIARKHKLLVVEDAAQAPLAKYKGKFAGTLGDIGIYSLNYHKHIHTGEGGMLVTNNDRLAEKMRLIRNHAEAVVEGKGVADLVNMVGCNFRLTEVQAAIGREQLKKLRGLVAERIRNCWYLARELGKIPGIRAAKTRPGATHVYYMHPFLFDEKIVGIHRDIFINAVKAELPAIRLREGEGTRIGCGYVKPLYLFPIFQKRIAFGRQGYPFTSEHYRGKVSYRKGLCPTVERLYETELFVHELMRPGMTKRDLDDVVRAFHKVYAHREELMRPELAVRER